MIISAARAHYNVEMRSRISLIEPVNKHVLLLKARTMRTSELLLFCFVFISPSLGQTASIDFRADNLKSKKRF